MNDRPAGTRSRRSAGSRRFRWLFAAALLPLALAACSSSNSGSNASTAGASGAKDAIKVGLVTDETGDFGPILAPGAAGIQAHVDYINAHGGIKGHPVDLITLDSATNTTQGLQDFKTLIATDHVALIIDRSLLPLPSQYVVAAKVPVIRLGGDPGDYLASAPNIFPTGGQIPAWGAETAYWLVKDEKIKPAKVAVLYSPSNAAWNAFITEYWHKLGVTSVTFAPDAGPTANCSSLVLKWKSAGVDYVDLQGQTEWPACVQAEHQLGWKPAKGQGGAVASLVGEALPLGQAMNGVDAGSPAVLSDGAPIYSGGNSSTQQMLAAMKQYQPKYATPLYENSAILPDSFANVYLMQDALKAAMSSSGTVTSAAISSYISGLKNWSSGLTPPVASFAPNCKTGSDGEIMGYWKYQSGQLTLDPTSGAQWLKNNWLGLGSCYLSHEAGKVVANS